jgi:hypothetical protein
MVDTIPRALSLRVGEVRVKRRSDKLTDGVVDLSEILGVRLSSNLSC